MRLRLVTCAVFVAVVAMAATTSRTAEAQPVLTERARLFTGYNTDYRPAPLERLHDPFIGAAPGVNLLHQMKSLVLSADYTLTGVYRFETGSEISNLGVLAMGIDLSAQTQLLFSISGGHSSLTNFLLNSPTSSASQPPGSTGTANPTIVTIVPPATQHTVSGRVFQGLRHAITGRLTYTQSAEASAFSTLPDAPPTDTFFTGAGMSLDYGWQNDAVGAVVAANYGITLVTPPALDQRFATIAVTPRWRHDWSPTLSSTISAGGAVAFDIAPGLTDPQFAPSGRASLLYIWAPTTFELSYSTGFFPSFLTNQLTEAHLVSLRVATPISEKHRILLGGSVSYGKTSLINFDPAIPDVKFDSIFTDVDVTWQALEYMSVFGRYQFLAQIADRDPTGINPSFLRDTVFVGVLFTSRPPPRGGGAAAVPLGFPQRVDGNDNRSGRTNLDDERNEQRSNVETQMQEDERNARERDPNAPQQRVGPSRWIYITPARPPQEVGPRDSQPVITPGN